MQTSASALLLDSSDSHSVSSTSFISAVSSQEDLTLVNLHMQVNKPIVDSPLLMSTYINHLSQVSTSRVGSSRGSCKTVLTTFDYRSVAQIGLKSLYPLVPTYLRFHFSKDPMMVD